MHVHIGKKIQERMKELRISPAFLAERINTSRQNIYGIFRRKSIDTDLLLKISEELNFDFFTFFKLSVKGPDKTVSRKEFEELRCMVKDLKNDYQALRANSDKKSNKKKR